MQVVLERTGHYHALWVAHMLAMRRGRTQGARSLVDSFSSTQGETVNEKAKTVDAPKVINYVQFRSPVPIGGDFATIEYWSVLKHGPKIQIAERGNWVHLTFGTQVTRVPMTNVACIRDGEV